MFWEHFRKRCHLEKIANPWKCQVMQWRTKSPSRRLEKPATVNESGLSGGELPQRWEFLAFWWETADVRLINSFIPFNRRRKKLHANCIWKYRVHLDDETTAWALSRHMRDTCSVFVNEATHAINVSPNESRAEKGTGLLPPLFHFAMRSHCIGTEQRFVERFRDSCASDFVSHCLVSPVRLSEWVSPGGALTAARDAPVSSSAEQRLVFTRTKPKHTGDLQSKTDWETKLYKKCAQEQETGFDFLLVESAAWHNKPDATGITGDPPTVNPLSVFLSSATLFLSTSSRSREMRFVWSTVFSGLCEGFGLCASFKIEFQEMDTE